MAEADTMEAREETVQVQNMNHEQKNPENHLGEWSGHVLTRSKETRRLSEDMLRSSG